MPSFFDKVDDLLFIMLIRILWNVSQFYFKVFCWLCYCIQWYWLSGCCLQSFCVFLVCSVFTTLLSNWLLFCSLTMTGHLNSEYSFRFLLFCVLRIILLSVQLIFPPSHPSGLDSRSFNFVLFSLMRVNQMESLKST